MATQNFTSQNQTHGGNQLFIGSAIFDNASNQIASVSPPPTAASSLRSARQDTWNINTIIRDINNQVIGNINGLGQIYTSVLGGAGRIIATVNPLNYRSSVRQALSARRYRSNSAVSEPFAPNGYIRDAASQRVASINALGNAASSVYSANGSLIASQSELGFLTSFILDAASQRICVVDANNGRSTTIFSNRGYVSATQDQLGALTTFNQDSNGNTILRVDARSWPTTYAVDQLNRTAQTQYIDSTRVTNSWDAAGQLVIVADTTGITSMVWDLDSRKTAVQNPTGINLTSTLDAIGNRLVLKDNFGTTSYTWDQQSRLLSIWNPLNELTTIQWDNLDREQHRVLGNGCTTSHIWDAAGRETLRATYSPAGAALVMFTNTYSATGSRLTALRVDSVRSTYSFDSASQLVSEASGGTMAYSASYVWDPNGNRIRQFDSGVLTTRTFAANNSLLSIASLAGPTTMVSSDANGNRILEASTLGSVTMIWTPENKLAVSQLPTGEVITNTFADDGVRRSKNDNSTLTVYTMDEMNVLLETDGSNTLQNRYVTYPDRFGGLASQHAGGATSYYAFDSSFNTRALINAAGSVTDNYSGTAFGFELQTGSGSPNTRRFGGEIGYVRDFLNRLQIGQRPYDAITGAWPTMDPIGFNLGTWNQCEFARNNPVMWSDPTGLYCNGGLEISTPSVPVQIIALSCGVQLSLCYKCHMCHGQRQNCLQGSVSLSCSTDLAIQKWAKFLKDLLKSGGITKRVSDIVAATFKNPQGKGIVGAQCSLPPCDQGCLPGGFSFTGGDALICASVFTLQIDMQTGNIVVVAGICGVPSIGIDLEVEYCSDGGQSQYDRTHSQGDFPLPPRNKARLF